MMKYIETRYLHLAYEENGPRGDEHEALEKRLLENPSIQVPTVVLHGADDGDNLPETSDGKERFFASFYERRVLTGTGHFIPREAPDEVLAGIRQLLSE